MIDSIGIALTGLDAASKKLYASASNIANVQTTGSLDGEPKPYAPLEARSETNSLGGVHTTIGERANPFTPAYDADSPFADENGIIGVPNINLAEEAVNTTLAKLQYKANLKTLQAASDLGKELLKVLDEKA